MKINLLFIAFFFLTLNIQAQYSYAKAEDYSDIKSRPLIVEMLEVDEKLIEKWKKKKSKEKKEDKIAEYQDKIDKYSVFVTDYNSLIKKAIENHWNINPDIIYKTTAEVKELIKNDSEEYTVLWYSETNSKRQDEFGFTYFPNFTVPTLNFSRIEKGRIKTDYCYFINYTHDRNDAINYSDFVLSLKLMKQHMDYIIKNDKKKFSFHKYVLEVSPQNCPDFSGKTAFIQEEAIHEKTSLSEINANFSGEISTLTDDEISKAIEGEEDRIIGFFFPFSIVVGSIGPASKARIQYVRSFVNTNTGEIYTNMGGKNGQFFDAYFRKKEFEKYDSCK